MPDIRFSCPGCKISLKVPDTFAGKKIKCPKCAAVAAVPVATGPAPAPLAAPAAVKTAPPPPMPAPSSLAGPKPPPVGIKPSSRATPPPPPPFQGAEDDDPESPSSQRMKRSPTKKGGLSLLTPFVVVAVGLYIAGFVLVYLGILLPMPKPLNDPRSGPAERNGGQEDAAITVATLPAPDKVAAGQWMAANEKRRLEAAKKEQEWLAEIGRTEAAKASRGGALASIYVSDKQIKQIALSPDGETLAIASWEKKVRLYDVRTCTLKHTLAGNPEFYSGIAFSPDGETLAVTDDKSVILWDVKTGKQKRTLPDPGGLSRLAFSPDGSLLAGSGHGGNWGKEYSSLRIWDLQTGSLLPPLTCAATHSRR